MKAKESNIREKLTLKGLRVEWILEWPVVVLWGFELSAVSALFYGRKHWLPFPSDLLL